MNELQLKELSALLETFSRRYPDRSPDNIKKTLEEALTALSEVKPLTAQDVAEKNSCMLFDTGRFKDIVLAYLIISMRAANSPQDEAMKLLDTLNQAFDKFTAEEALERYRGSIQQKKFFKINNTFPTSGI